MLIVLSQESLAINTLSKYSIGLLSAVYLFFSVQLIKSKKRSEKIIGIFFYVFPLFIGVAYYAADWEKLKARISVMQSQDIILFVGALFTLMLAFYYSFKSHADKKGL